MSDEVQFDIDTEPRQKYQAPAHKITQWVIQHSGGRVEDEKQANRVLLGVVVLLVLIALFLASSGNQKPFEPSRAEMLRVTPPSIGTSVK